MFRIREATSDDNNALLGLEAQSPQGTGISILIDREDYFYRSKLHNRSKILIAEENDKLVGVMAFAIKQVHLEDSIEPVAYFYDLRGEATYRRSMKRGLFRLWKAVLEEIEAAGAQFIYGHVKADNFDSLSVSTKIGGQIVSSFDILSLPCLRGADPGLDPHLDHLEQEVEQIEQAVGIRNLRPPSLQDAYKRGNELGYLRGIFRLERKDSSAQISAWDLTRIYRGRVLRMPLELQVLAKILNPLARICPLPRIPVAGEQIAYLTLFDPICKGPDGRALLKQLIQKIRRQAYHDKADILTIFAYQDDPLVTLPRIFPERILHYHTVIRPITVVELPDPPFYLDVRDI